MTGPNTGGRSNLLIDGTTAYTYDSECRIISAGSSTYQYDADGRRIRKTTTAGGLHRASCKTSHFGLRNLILSEECERRHFQAALAAKNKA
jgi:hypothetical protein